MIEYKIIESASYKVQSALKATLSQHPNFLPKQVKIHYNVNKGLGNYMDGKNLPVKIYGLEKNQNGLEEAVISLAPLTAGYSGSGPNDLCKILKELDFIFDENDILSKEKVSSNGEIELTYFTK